jgi:hypothetical protein
MKKKNYLERVEEEMKTYNSAEEAAIDHLNMAHSHLFEEFEGRDIDQILSDIVRITLKLTRNKVKV